MFLVQPDPGLAQGTRRMQNRLVPLVEKGLNVHYAVSDSEFGSFVLASTTQGVSALLFLDGRDPAQALQDEFPAVACEPRAGELEESVEAVLHAIRYPEKSPALPMDLVGTPFQRSVWAELQRIPAGVTTSYTDIAHRLGRPLAVRAVASACARNHVALLVPCHRVVRQDGSLGGYKWGLERKRDLLSAEKKAAAVSA